MKRVITSIGLLAMCIAFMSGCTSWAGISQADKPGSYYLVKNKNMGILGIHTGVLLCTSSPSNGDLDCKNVNVNNE